MPKLVVTGLGCVSPFGPGVDALRAGLRQGRPTEAPRTFDPAGYRIQGVYHAKSPDLNPQERNFPLHLAERALAEAFGQARFTSGALSSCGLAMASTSAGWHLPDEVLSRDRPPLAPGTDVTALRKEGPALHLAEKWNLDGPHATLSAACASSTAAVAWAAERIIDGDAPVMAVGAVDVLTEVVFAGFHSMRLLSPASTRPFAPDRHGFVLAEGAAFVILEDDEHARARGASILADLAGWAASSDAAHITTPNADGIGRSLREAISNAGNTPEEIQVYHAHGTASRASDAAEAEAVARVLRPSGDRVTVTAIKSSLGHTEGAAGLFSLVAAVDAIVHARLPPVLGVDQPDDAFHAVALAEADGPAQPAAPAVVHASGFGGANCSVVLDRPGAARLRRRPWSRRVLLHLAVRATDAQPVHVVPFARRTGDDHGLAQLPEPLTARFPRIPGADRVTAILGSAVGTALGALGTKAADEARHGGLLTGTSFGSQANHAQMWNAIRTGGPRSVDPLNFARSTYNVPASQCSSAFGIEGRVESFLGASAGVEAMLSAADLVASGQRNLVLAAGYDASENRLWRQANDPDVPASATVIVLGTPESASLASSVEISGRRRLAPTTRSRRPAALKCALDELNQDDACDEIWLDPSGLDPAEVEELLACLAEPTRLTRSAAGAASPLDHHIQAVEHLVNNRLECLTVVTTAGAAPTAIVRYKRYDHV